jgi:hypothetical protein
MFRLGLNEAKRCYIPIARTGLCIKRSNELLLLARPDVPHNSIAGELRRW